MVNATEDSSSCVPLVITMTRSRAVSVMETSLKATLGIGDGEYDEMPLRQRADAFMAAHLK